jgi:hypothetical protein
MGGSLNADGTIIFGSANGLFQVPAEGGKPVALTTIGPAESGHLWPRFLPDGRRYLYLAASADASGRAVFVGSLDSKDKTKVLSADSNAIYVEPTPAAGYLIFHNEATVYAQPFNIKTLAVSGKPTRLANEVVYDPGNAKSSFDASDAGVLIYYVNTLGTGGGGQDSWPWRIMWSDRSASDGGDVGPVAVYRGVELSPDGKRVATHKHEGAGGDIWVLEPPPSAPKRITFDATQDNSSPVWSPNGSQIVFASLRKGKWGLYVTRSDGSGAEEYETIDLPAQRLQAFASEGHIAHRGIASAPRQVHCQGNRLCARGGAAASSLKQTAVWVMGLNSRQAVQASV